MSKASEIAKEERGLVTKTHEQEVDELFGGKKEGMDKVSELPEIKILHAAGLFQLPDNTTTPKLEGILLHDHHHNAWWEKTLNDNEPPSAPDCFSIELVKGESMRPHPSCRLPQVKFDEGTLTIDKNNPALSYFEGACDGTCAECDLNKWGSKGDGKACSNKIALFCLIPGYFVPLRLEVSASSLKNCEKYTDSFKIKRKRYQAFGTIFTLKTKTKGSNTFSIMSFSRGAEETNIENLKKISRIMNDHMDLMLKVPEIKDELAE